MEGSKGDGGDDAMWVVLYCPKETNKEKALRSVSICLSVV